MRSVSMRPSATHETGHSYFAQTGNSHFAATIKQASIVNSLPLAYDALRPAVILWRVPCGASQASLGSPRSAETHHTVRELIPVTITMNSAMISPRPNRSWNFELKEKLRWPLPHKLYAPMKK